MLVEEEGGKNNAVQQAHLSARTGMHRNAFASVRWRENKRIKRYRDDSFDSNEGIHTQAGALGSFGAQRSAMRRAEKR